MADAREVGAQLHRRHLPDAPVDTLGQLVEAGLKAGALLAQTLEGGRVALGAILSGVSQLLNQCLLSGGGDRLPSILFVELGELEIAE